MAKGGARPGAGRPRKPLSDHLLRGTYRRDRHGASAVERRADAGATIDALAADRGRPGGSGDTRAARWSAEVLERFELTFWDGWLLIEAAKTADVLHDLRMADAGGLSPREAQTRDRQIRQWTQLYTTLLRDLRGRP